MFSDSSYWVLNYRIRNNHLNYSNKLFFSTYDRGQSVVQKILLKDIDVLNIIIPSYVPDADKIALIDEHLKSSSNANFYSLTLQYIPISTVL